MPKLRDTLFGLRNVILAVGLLMFGEGLLALVIGWAGFWYPADFMVNIGLWLGVCAGIGFTIRLLPVDGKAWMLGAGVSFLFALLVLIALAAFRGLIGDPLSITFVQLVIVIFGYTLLGLFTGLIAGVLHARSMALDDETS